MPTTEPPERPDQNAYHYHVFDYASSKPFTLSQGQPSRNNEEFYSLYRDMIALRDYGAATGVPYIKLTAAGKALGQPKVANLASPTTLVLSFGNANAENRVVLITGGIHGREWVAAEMAYLIAEYLIRNFSAPPSKYRTRIRDLLYTRHIHVAPMLNPVGNSYTVFTAGDAARDWRKNRRPLPPGPPGWLKVLSAKPGAGGPPWNQPFRDVALSPDGKTAQYAVPTYNPKKFPPPNPDYQLRVLRNAETGVDLNRNFHTIAWGYDTKDDKNLFLNQGDPASETYFGPKPLSEDEAGNITDFAVSLPPRMVSIDYHSYGRFIIFPGEYADAAKLDTDYEELGSVLQLLTKSRYGDAYALGTPLKLVKYSVTGTIDSYLAQFRNTRAFSVELDGTGFSLPATQIQQVFETNIRGVLAAIAAGHTDRGSLISAWAEFNQWDVFTRGNRLPDPTRRNA
jgi:hypothetical protein